MDFPDVHGGGSHADSVAERATVSITISVCDAKGAATDLRLLGHISVAIGNIRLR